MADKKSMVDLSGCSFELDEKQSIIKARCSKTTFRLVDESSTTVTVAARPGAS